MWPLPGNCKDEFTFRPPQRLGSSDGPAFDVSRSLESLHTRSSQKLAHVQNLLERYRTMKEKGQVQKMNLGRERHELDAAVYRHELAVRRMSR